MDEELELTANKNNDTIGADDNAGTGAGAGKAPEDTLEGMRTIIDQQNAQIEALIERNDTLTKQIVELARSGAHPTDGKEAQQSDEGSNPLEHTGAFGFNGEPLKGMDLRDLGRELAKQ